MPEKNAFITGITGQDGSYLTELLLEKGYAVHGLVTPLESAANGNLRHLVADPAILGKRLFLHAGSFEELTHLRRIIDRTKPDEFYHFAGQSSPRLSFELPEVTANSVGIATLRLLEILRGLQHPTRFFNASSAEVFGTPSNSRQDEQTPVNPATPYGAAKAFAQQMTRIYRTAHKLPACSAILYNHESPRRNESFVTMKIARAAARIKKGLQTELKLGSMTAQRDWGWAPDYVEGMWRMLQADQCDDYILATGELHSVADLVEKAFQCVGLNWRDHVKQDPSLITAAEPVAPCGNPAKAEKQLNWSRTVNFDSMVERLVASQYDSAG
ncbi:GDPmannose 4,6-dehydratase [Ereboglobus sp. PH5-10]|uniref:GDP-mannose 4,6-dehydratase n=1 Tax=Ereboglobus sp. PH5-10 TaxID=2940629 RepID=UPI002405E078|nr:GDP-mannose 4,6-dehydratase [Ereboglobus sp. PH5-10]MDF9827426.1 GDPmannose 4,6-dehydratase [Ereboglobus sp. PH5-10]